MSKYYSSRVLHFGPYEGKEIDYVVEVDPMYILEAVLIQGHGISQEAVARARQLVDTRDEWDDFDFANDQAYALGYITDDDY
jgi:hypothetical protein